MCKVVRERAYSSVWHPSETKLLLAIGDKVWECTCAFFFPLLLYSVFMCTRVFRFASSGTSAQASASGILVLVRVVPPFRPGLSLRRFSAWTFLQFRTQFYAIEAKNTKGEGDARGRGRFFSFFLGAICLALQVGNVGLWTVDEDGGNDDDPTDGVFLFRPHTMAVPRLSFDPIDGNKLISTSYDGTVRRMDVEKGAFEQVNRRKRRFASGCVVDTAKPAQSSPFHRPPLYLTPRVLASMCRCSLTRPAKTLSSRTATSWQRTGYSCYPTASVMSPRSTFVPTPRRGDFGMVYRVSVHKSRNGGRLVRNVSPAYFYRCRFLLPTRRFFLWSTQVWKREAHEKKANTVHTHPSNSHLFVTVSGARRRR